MVFIVLYLPRNINWQLNFFVVVYNFPQLKTLHYGSDNQKIETFVTEMIIQMHNLQFILILKLEML